jgi:hypothetical protein
MDSPHSLLITVQSAIMCNVPLQDFSRMLCAGLVDIWLGWRERPE